ncbi:MAG: insulinase family protein [Treponema sp.]|nr:insulinase family protein [Treponema sp.]
MFKKNIKSLFAFIVLTLFVFTCATADFAGLGNASDKVPLSEKIITGILPNGLRYYILENTMPENRANLALVVNAGSVVEKDEERGFAHFTEHLAFKGTERFPENELIDYLRSLGMRFGPDANAYTSYDETVYHFDVPVETVNGIKRIPQRALAILDDWTYKVSFNEEDVKSESRVVLEEMRTRSGAMERVRRTTLPVLFSGSAYENRDVIGLADIIENATSQQISAFYERWYKSDNMALVFAGDFDGKTLEAELVSHFNMPKSENPVNRPRYDLPPPKKDNFHIEIITEPELTSISFNIYYKQRQTSKRGTIASYRESVIDYLIDIMLTLRFEEAELNPHSASNSSWGGIWRWGANSRFYTMGTQPKTGNVQEALRELLLEKESIQRFGFTQNEIDSAKLRLVSFMEKQLSEKDRMESRTYVRGITRHFIFGEDMASIEWEVNAVKSLLAGIVKNEISRAVKKYFELNDCIVFLISPQAEEDNLPSKEEISAIFREAKNARITPRQDAAITGELLDRIPAPGAIISDNLDVQTGAYILELSNGAKVILKETANRNNEIILYSIARGGTANATEQTIVSVNLLSEMLQVSGLGPHSRTDMVNKLTGKQVSASFWTSGYYRGFQGSSTTQDLKTLFEMLHLFFTQPKLDTNAIAAMIDQYKTNLAHQDDNPQRYFSRELTKIINNNHPLFKPLELKDLESVSIEDAFSFLKLCINPADYTFVFTGNLDSQTMREYAAVYLASIPNTASMNSWNDPGITRPLRGKREIFRGVDDRSTVYLGWFASAPSVFNEHTNQSAAVLSEYLDILLTDEIREKMGGVYSISAGASVSVIPDGEYRLSVYFVCNPERVEELAAAVQESITKIFTQPVSIETFNKAKEALLMGHERSMQRNLHIAQSYANSHALYNTPLNRLNLRPDAIRRVRAEDVQVLCRQMLINGPVQVVLYPVKP